MLCTKEDVLEESVADGASPEQVYVVVSVSLTPAEAQVMIETLDSNGSTARAVRDPLSRVVLEAIKDSQILEEL